MQPVPIDLRKNPDIAAFVKDMEPGDPIALFGTIKSLDDQTLVVTVNEVDEDKEDREEGEERRGAKPSEYGEGELPEDEVTDPTTIP